jgi:hypothetical protein
MQFVVPGRVVHLLIKNGQISCRDYRLNEILGFYHAVLGDHRLSCLRSITPLTHGIEDHKMANHIKALRTLRNKATPLQSYPPPPWQVSTLRLSLPLASSE